MPTVDRTAAEWYIEAERAYSEDHQGCPWCGGQHRVHHVRQATKITFACQRCDFQVFFDPRTKRYNFIPGENLSQVSDTMLGYPIYKK